MDWLALIIGVIKALMAGIEYLNNKQALDTASAAILSKNLQGALDEIRQAAKTRADVDARTSGPDADAKLRDDPANLYRD